MQEERAPATNTSTNGGPRAVFVVVIGIDEATPAVIKKVFRDAMDELAVRISKNIGGITLDFCTGMWDTALRETASATGIERNETARFTALVLEEDADALLGGLRADVREIVYKHSLPVHHVQVCRSSATAHHFLIANSAEHNNRLGSIRNHIASAETVDETALQQVIAAATLANAHSFICRLPLGYDTDVQALSRLQKERVDIALAYMTQSRQEVVWTVHTCIRSGKDDACLSEIIDAAKQANIYNQITEMREGFDTKMTDLNHKQREQVYRAQALMSPLGSK